MKYQKSPNVNFLAKTSFKSPCITDRKNSLLYIYHVEFIFQPTRIIAHARRPPKPIWYYISHPQANTVLFQFPPFPSALKWGCGTIIRKKKGYKALTASKQIYTQQKKLLLIFETVVIEIIELRFLSIIIEVNPSINCRLSILRR